ncbi:MAG: penicillin-binding protein 1C, partial [Alphaproteobacteria bacterium]|nr:penicillin-binding protein 1C [Alphaproteobacteria bacterium]
GAGRAMPAKKGRPPRIVFPLDASLVALPQAGRSIGLSAEGGRRPLTWLVDGAPLAARKWNRVAKWRPDGPGFTEIVLIDALGRRAAARVRLVRAE